MESIEKLRELAADMSATEILDHMEVSGKFLFHTDWLHSWHIEFNRLCDEIEREISERHIELPVDADGVPIRVGDKLVLQHKVKEKPSEVESITFDGEDWYFTSSDGFFNTAGFCHVKPRTLEDVLADFRFKASLIYDDQHIGGEDRADKLHELDAKCAVEIRELMEVDE